MLTRNHLAPVVCVLLLAACTETPPLPEPAVPAQVDWCERVAPGPAGSVQEALAMSSAHALVRFFGVGSSYLQVDSALVHALEGETIDWDAAARVYADVLEDVCALEVTAQPLPAARVEEVGTVAVIHPGTGEVVLPPGANAVAIDLRELPAAPGLEQALEQALAAASTHPVARVSLRVRTHEGLTDEVHAGNVYSNDTEQQEPPPYLPSGQMELPVALLTGPTLAPAAARFAVDLRIARRAWLFGEPVFTAVAESRWVPIGTHGLAIRTGQLEDAQGRIPDVLTADRSLQGTLADTLGELPGLGVPPAVDRRVEYQRAPLYRRDPIRESQPAIAHSTGIARANLLIAHGATRRFFPYFPVVGDGIDARLLETLAAVEAQPVGRRRIIQLLQRFSEVLQDGHGFVYGAAVAPAGYGLVILEEIAGEPVVRRSGHPGLYPGDTLVSVGERPIADWYAEELARTSASTPGYRHVVASRRLMELSGVTPFGVRAPDGSVRSVELIPREAADWVQFSSAPSVRPAGRLTDLGAPNLHYLNLAHRSLEDVNAFYQALREAAGAQGLVLDMRGYPTFNRYHFEAAQRLIPTAFQSTLFRFPQWKGPDAQGLREQQDTYEPEPSPSFTGPIVLLTGPHAVSASENFSMLLVGAQRVRVVGRRSAGTMGNVTTMLLPGAFQFKFTSMDVRYPDGSPIHGVGIVPHVEVTPTAEDLAAGRDPELLEAIEQLRAEG